MNTVTLHFKADNQQLTALDGLYKLASNTVEYVKAIFTLGENWAGFDVVRAAWYTDFECISTVLDGNGECFVPWEVLSRPEGVTINLYGCDLEEESDGEAVLVDRLTTYPVKAILVDVDARVCGSETKPVTPSQFEQYIAIVQELVGTVRDITSCVLNPDYTLTINYSDDTSDTVGPIRGEQGEQGPTGPAGNGISKIEKISTAGLVDTYRITFTNGTHKDYTVTNGAKGDTGNGIESIYLTGTSGAVKTYTILFTNGNTFEYQVTDGEVTNAVFEQAFPTDTASGAIASFPDGSNLFPLKKCEVTLEPIQDLSHGDPSPSNICPISGRSSVGVDNTPYGSYLELGTIYDDSGQAASSNTRIRTDYIPITNVTKVDLIGKEDGEKLRGIHFYNASKTWISAIASSFGFSLPYTVSSTPSGCAYVRLVFQEAVNTNTESASGKRAILNWENIATIPLGTTVYGGTLDAVSGVLTVTHTLYTVTGTESFSTTGAGQHIITNPSLATLGAKPYDSNEVADMYATFAKAKSYASLNVSGTTDGIGIGGNSTTKYIIVGSEQYNNWSAIVGEKILYPLATPTEIQLTPTQISILKGQNNIFSDGQINVTYKADVQRWVEKKLGA